MAEVIITSWIDKYCVSRYQKSADVLLNDLSSNVTIPKR